MIKRSRKFTRIYSTIERKNAKKSFRDQSEDCYPEDLPDEMSTNWTSLLDDDVEMPWKNLHNQTSSVVVVDQRVGQEVLNNTS